MKKYLPIILTVIILTGCSEREKPEPLSFSIPAYLSDCDDTDFLEIKEQLLFKKRFFGCADNFSFIDGGFQWEIAPDEHGLLFFAVNRSGSAIKDISFNFTYKTKSDFVFYNEPVTICGEQFGTLENNFAFPVIFIIDGGQWKNFVAGYFSAEHELLSEIKDLSFIKI